MLQVRLLKDTGGSPENTNNTTGQQTTVRETKDRERTQASERAGGTTKGTTPRPRAASSLEAAASHASGAASTAAHRAAPRHLESRRRDEGDCSSRSVAASGPAAVADELEAGEQARVPRPP